MQIDQEYNKEGFIFPSDELNPKKKNKEWHNKAAQAIYSRFARGQTGIRYNRHLDFVINRRYAQGRQSTEKYMNILVPQTDAPQDMDNSRKGLMNVSWEIFNVASKYRSVAINMMLQADYDVVATSIDENAGTEKKDMEAHLWAEKYTAELMQQVSDMVGVEFEKSSYIPQSVEEMEMFRESGGFKLKTEISIEKLIEYSFQVSKWDDVIKQKIYEDFFDLGIAATMDYVDPLTQKVKSKYIDPARLIIPFSRSKNFEDINWWGFIDDITVADLRIEAKRAKTPLKEDEIKDIIQKQSSKNSNTEQDIDTFNDEPNELGNYGYDEVKVKVLRFEMFSVDKKFGKTREANGQKYYYPEKYGKGEFSEIKTVYKGTWVIGTDYVYDYGKQYDIPKPDKKEAKLSLHVMQISERSIIENMIPLLDQVQLNFLKLQNALAMSAPSGLAIEKSALSNINIGGRDLQPLDLLKIRTDTGHLIYKATTGHRSPQNPNSGKPIQELNGGIGPQLNEFISIFELNFRLLEEATGINRTASAATPAPRQPVKITEIALAQSNLVLASLLNGYNYLTEEAAKSMALRLQIVSRGNMDEYYPALGKHNLSIIKIGSDKTFNQYGIKLEMKPNMEAKQRVMQAADIALNQPLSEGGISYSDWLEVTHYIEVGKTKYAKLILSYKEKQNLERARQIQQENMEMNAKFAQDTEAVKSEKYAENKAVDTQSDIAVEDKKALGRKDDIMLKHQAKLGEIVEKESAAEVTI